jgi:hypothetical protein
MSFDLNTTDSLKANALWLAGEPQDGSSDYDGQSLVWMQLIYNTLINGGTLGTKDIAAAAGLYEHVIDIPTTDWLWLRKFPRFAFVTTPGVLGSAASVSRPGPPPEVIGTVALVNGSTTITFSAPAPKESVQTWRLFILNQASGIANPPITVPRITNHVANGLTATMDTPWPQETQTVSNFVLFQAEYPLPADFIRFTEAPQIHGGWSGQNVPHLNIGSPEQIGDYYPITNINQGPPTAAARLTTNMLQLNRWDTQSYRIEFSYIFQPDPLIISASQQPLIPLRYRQILSIGAAMLIAHDKMDQRMNTLSSQFREIVAHMGVEYRKEMMSGSEWNGRHLFRRNRSGRRGLLRTSSGLPLFVTLLALGSMLR